MTKNNIDASAVSEGEVTANALLEALGTTLEPDLLVEALTHRSFSHENPGAKNYERLEFLGDAVLGAIGAGQLGMGVGKAGHGALPGKPQLL